jgi:hypothetical protein
MQPWQPGSIYGSADLSEHFRQRRKNGNKTRAMLKAFPAALDIPGPHGIPLIIHSENGGKDAIDVLAYLK